MGGASLETFSGEAQLKKPPCMKPLQKHHVSSKERKSIQYIYSHQPLWEGQSCLNRRGRQCNFHSGQAIDVAPRHLVEDNF